MSLAELPRICAEIAGIEQHPWNGDDLPSPGIGVAQLNPPVHAGDPRVQEAQRTWNLDTAATARLATPFMCATDGRFKLIRREGAELLHDLEADPLEVRPQRLNGGPLPGAAGAALPRLRAALDHPAAGRHAAAAPADATEQVEPTEEETREIEERMRLLGYL
jgi:hypothetical protein